MYCCSFRYQEEVKWKLSTTENTSRMRLKLAPNHNFVDHLDASRQRDTGTADAVENSQILDIPVPVTPEPESHEFVLSGEEEGIGDDTEPEMER